MSFYQILMNFDFIIATGDTFQKIMEMRIKSCHQSRIHFISMCYLH